MAKSKIVIVVAGGVVQSVFVPNDSEWDSLKMAKMLEAAMANAR